jgi:hypothetical protein
MNQPPKLIEKQTRQPPLQLVSQGRVGSTTQSLVFGDKLNSGITGKEGNFEAFMNSVARSSQGDEHLKPPKPNDSSRKQPCSVQEVENEDEMVVETPLSHQ